MRTVLHYMSGLILLCAIMAPARSQGRIQMTADPVFSGMAGNGVTPIVVTLQNAGPSVDGAVTVDASGMGIGGGRTYLYPVSLPTGSVKKIVTYPRVDNFLDSLRVSFNGSFHGQKPSLDVPVNASGAFNVALIGDQVGGMGALRLLTPQVNTDSPEQGAIVFRDAYAKPEDAPDRAAGYATLTALVLSNGAERMLPRQWDAIRRWTMAGGTVVCTGGAGAVYLQTPGAAAILPVRDVQGGTASTLSLPDLKTPLPAGPYALMTGAPVSAASVLAREGNQVTMAARRLGAGSVVFLAFSPFEAPLRGWDGSGSFWSMVLRQGKPSISWQGLRRAAGNVDAGMTQMAVGYPGGPPVPGAAPPEEVNPFHIELPPIGMVAAIFAVYFLLAVPVTYLVLKKAKRLEWAWVTNPVLAGIFAFVFYLFAAQLYKAGMSRRTSGVLVASANGKDALFLGYTQMFFPRGGNHPLDVPDAESLEISAPAEDPYGHPRNRQDTLTTVDTGMVTAPDFSVSNLAFRSIYYVQNVAFSGEVTARLRRDRDGGVTGTVRNGTQRDLKDAVLIVPTAGRFAVLGSLKAGATAQVRATQSALIERKSIEPVRRKPGRNQPAHRIVIRQDFSPDMQSVVRATPLAASLTRNGAGVAVGGAILLGRTSGEDYGPNVGRYVSGGAVDVLVSLPVEGGA